MDLTAVGQLLGLSASSVSKYLTESHVQGGRYLHHPFPEPNGRIGNSPWWADDRAGEIVEWAQGRIGQGMGGGRPRKNQPVA